MLRPEDADKPRSIMDARYLMDVIVFDLKLVITEF
jgi:hypothetical protein